MSKLSLFVIIFALAASNLFFVVREGRLNRQLAAVEKEASSREWNRRGVDFGLVFVNKVLRARNEVDFETRLDLENQVRGLNNPEILAGWREFTQSQTESEAQENVKSFLEILIRAAGATSTVTK